MEIKQELVLNRNIEVNKGYNFLNIDKEEQTEHQYYIKVYLDIKQDLIQKDKKIVVDSNLPISRSYHYGSDTEIKDFLESLDKFCKKPFFIVNNGNNRKDTIRIYNLSNKFRDTILIFNDIKITFGELAIEELKKEGIDFLVSVEEILKQQQAFSKENQRLIERLIYLKEKVKTLRVFIDYNERYNYRLESQPKSLKIMITPTEYNQKLKDIEKEMTKISEKFDLDIDELDYLIIEQKVDMEKWIDYNEEGLLESWESNDEYDSYENFEDFAKQMYEESEKTISIKPN